MKAEKIAGVAKILERMGQVRLMMAAVGRFKKERCVDPLAEPTNTEKALLDEWTRLYAFLADLGVEMPDPLDVSRPAGIWPVDADGGEVLGRCWSLTAADTMTVEDRVFLRRDLDKMRADPRWCIVNLKDDKDPRDNLASTRQALIVAKEKHQGAAP